jgi:hypothetical protein
MSRGNISSRLERLETSARSGPSGRCQECALPPDGPGRIVLINDGTPAESFPEDPEERCSRCGRPLWCVVRLVYSEEGGGGLS